MHNELISYSAVVLYRGLTTIEATKAATSVKIFRNPA